MLIQRSNVVKIIRTYHDPSSGLVGLPKHSISKAFFLRETHLSLISGRIIWLSRSSCCCRSCDEACRWGRRFVSSQFSRSFFRDCFVCAFTLHSHSALNDYRESCIVLWWINLFHKRAHNLHAPSTARTTTTWVGWLMCVLASTCHVSSTWMHHT